MMTKLVASILASSTEEMLLAMRESTHGSDILELRVDAVCEPDLERLRAEMGKPLILTCRTRDEGGSFLGSEADRLMILRRGLELGFDYVDVELSSCTPELKSIRTNAKLILSHHSLQHRPDHLQQLVEKGLELGAHFIKIAVPTRSIADALDLASVGSVARERGVGFIPVALGPSGIAARVLASRFDAAWTYASARGCPATGPGQLDLEELLSLYRFRSIGAETRIYGIVGESVTRSLSPAMHNAHFDQEGLDAVYVPFEEEDLESFVEAARTLGFDGFSVTHPYKEKILPFLDEVEPEAKQIGAVNTVRVRKGLWQGYNTDVEGVISPVSKRVSIEGKRAVILGAGGAARAAAFGLIREGARVAIVARRVERARKLAEEVGAEAGRLEDIDRLGWDILINATPVGGGELVDELPVPIHDLEPGSIVLEMVYDPETTRLLELCGRLGARGIPGLEMLVAQAVRQAELWTGVRPSRNVLHAAARSELNRRTKGRGDRK